MGKESRAVWKGNWYRRKSSDDWRNPTSGKIASTPGGKGLGFERRETHIYASDSKAGPKKVYRDKKKMFERVLP